MIDIEKRRNTISILTQAIQENDKPVDETLLDETIVVQIVGNDPSASMMTIKEEENLDLFCIPLAALNLNEEQLNSLKDMGMVMIYCKYNLPDGEPIVTLFGVHNEKVFDTWTSVNPR